MNALVRTFLAVLAVMLPATALADPLGNLHQSFMARYDEANSKRDEQLKQLDQSYLAALLRQQDKAKASGKLDAVLPWVEEIQTIKTAANPLPKLAASAPAELKQMRGKHAESREKIVRSHALTLTGLADKMEQALKSQESDLTKAGNIDAALAAKHMRETLAQDQAITAARDLSKSSGPPGSTRPALRLRRFGDNLEVLVFYDRGGKVSMDSPVQNVREETGGKKELGDTQAKVLGEFVGAKGYTVDPHVAYHQVFDGKETPLLTYAGLLPEFKYEVEKDKGVKISYLPAAKNPYGYLGEVLPPLANMGAYRISAQYWLPKSNRVISGFRMVHGAGLPVGGKNFEKTGAWTEESTIGESSHASRQLFLYLNLPPDKTVADAAGDFIVLGEIKVEQIKFSAYVRERIAAKGDEPVVQDDPSKQPLFISNGEMVGK